jgi:hypothetical protein
MAVTALSRRGLLRGLLPGLLMAGGAGLALAACGRKNPPQAPKKTDDDKNKTQKQ